MKLLRPFLFAALAVSVLLPVAAQAATPLSGVPTQIRRGFFTTTDLGAFFTLGGEPGVSNAQVYLSLGVGYDIYATNDHFLAVGLGFSQGASAGSCFGDATTGGCIDGATGEPLSDNWTAQTVEANLLYGYQVIPRLMLTGKVLGGMAVIEPMAFSDTSNPVPLMGGALGVEYATQFDHFSLGLDAAAKYFIGPNIVGIAIVPRVKYTF